MQSLFLFSHALSSIAEALFLLQMRGKGRKRGREGGKKGRKKGADEETEARSE
jgi:hypothetical protein